MMSWIRNMISHLFFKLYKTNFDDAMKNAAAEGHIEIVAVLRGFDVVHDDLLQYHHKRQFYIKIYNELLPIAWHPDRFWDWCMPEDEKKEISTIYAAQYPRARVEI